MLNINHFYLILEIDILLLNLSAILLLPVKSVSLALFIPYREGNLTN